VGGFVAEHAESVELLQDGFADGVLETGVFELLEKAAGGLTWKPQFLVKKAHQGFREAAQFNGDCVRVGVRVSLCK
jgi:hypothetical protein